MRDEGRGLPPALDACAPGGLAALPSARSLPKRSDTAEHPWALVVAVADGETGRCNAVSWAFRNDTETARSFLDDSSA
jgi:hypothetical protein